MIKLKGTDLSVNKYEITPKQPGTGPKFWIHNPTKLEYRVMKTIMGNTLTGSDDYKKRMACAAFFQHGSCGDSSIGIEFWVDEEKKGAIDDFVFHFYESLAKAVQEASEEVVRAAEELLSSDGNNFLRFKEEVLDNIFGDQ